MSAAKHLAPALENGAVMSREEFHSLYAEGEGLERVELIEGVVYMPSPIKVTSHADPHALILLWLGTFAAPLDDVRALPPASVLLDASNEPEPDAMLIRTTSGWLSDDGYVAKAPELVVEIAGSSRSRDANQKRRAYERNGVREYIVWRTLDEAIDWSVLRNGVFAPKAPDGRGRIESEQFPCLVMDVPAMLAMDRKAVIAALA